MLFLACSPAGTGPHNEPAKSSRVNSVNQIVEEQSASLDGDPCSRREGGMIVQLDYRDCVELLPPERIRGTWFVGNEESDFLPEGVEVESVRLLSETKTPPEMDTWLDVEWPKQLEYVDSVPEPKGIGDTLTYEVEFIGRRARDVGQYGHGGLATHLIVLDEMLSIRPVKKVRTRVELRGVSCWVEDCSAAQARQRAERERSGAGKK